MSNNQYFSFYLGDNLFGINILLVREIIRNFTLTPAEHAPEIVKGLVNLRGQIITALDPAIAFQIEKSDVSGTNHCVILKTATELSRSSLTSELKNETIDDAVGILVDRFGEVYKIPDDDVETPPANINNVEGKFLSGVARVEDKLMMILKTSTVLQ